MTQEKHDQDSGGGGAGGEMGEGGDTSDSAQLSMVQVIFFVCPTFIAVKRKLPVLTAVWTGSTYDHPLDNCGHTLVTVEQTGVVPGIPLTGLLRLEESFTHKRAML